VSRRGKWLVAVPAAVLVAVVGGTWLYVHVVQGDAPAALTLSDTPGATTTGTSGASGTSGTAAGAWTVTAGSQAGYRVQEVLFGQHTTAVGRTSKVTGSLTLAGATVSAATFTVDMASVESDKSRRDSQYRGRIMATGEFPTSTFALSEPIPLGSLPADGATVTATATGDLTLRGVTRPVTFAVKARRSGDRMEVTGSIPVAFGDWGIPSPSFGPAEVEDHGDVEFLLVLRPGSGS
jgi:polyisoprenoid-binding protein YceI